MLRTIEWTGQHLRLLDQTKLPLETVYLDITDAQEVFDAIRRLSVRGAPAIGVAAAFGAYLGIRRHDGDGRSLLLRLDEVCEHLASSRPTAVNLAWALRRIKRAALAAYEGDEPAGGAGGAAPAVVKQRILDECIAMAEEDVRVCRAIGEHALTLLESVRPGPAPIRLLTHCNAGALATVAYGTALAPVYVGLERGRRFEVFADETRPLLQGARITACELTKAGVPVTLICDNMAGTVLSQGKVDAVIVGTDRVAANGDVANKIGTMPLAIVARHFGVPFFVACPVSTIDASLANGGLIPIEQRPGDEVTHLRGQAIAPEGVEVFNPAFDVTPAALVSAIITERGVVRPPYAFGEG